MEKIINQLEAKNIGSKPKEYNSLTELLINEPFSRVEIRLVSVVDAQSDGQEIDLAWDQRFVSRQIADTVEAKIKAHGLTIHSTNKNNLSEDALFTTENIGVNL